VDEKRRQNEMSYMRAYGRRRRREQEGEALIYATEVIDSDNLNYPGGASSCSFVTHLILFSMFPANRA
jgi:hypothetical protein